jgi:hypothetical protein
MFAGKCVANPRGVNHEGLVIYNYGLDVSSVLSYQYDCRSGNGSTVNAMRWVIRSSIAVFVSA